jgi:hypothetical protein
VARARNIKPGFFKNDDLAQCEHGARLLFAGLWTLADREGRLEDRPVRFKGELFAYDEKVDIEKWLKQLHARHFITRYEIDGHKYIQINKFKKHQNPHVKEPASTIPAPGAHPAGPADSLLLNPDSPSLNPESGILIPENGDPAPAPDTSDADELRDWLLWWNTLASEKLVPAGVNVQEPSQGVLKGWVRVKSNPKLRKMLVDRDAIRREIVGAPLCRDGWFRLEKLFGGCNRDGEWILEKLLAGGYRDSPKINRDPRGNAATGNEYLAMFDREETP